MDRGLGNMARPKAQKKKFDSSDSSDENGQD